MSSSFKPNPLSLSVPDPALDRWLRDSGYLDLLDSSTPAPAAAAPTRASPASTSSGPGAAADVLAFARTLASLLALNPFACLTAADLAAPTPSWSLAFIGPAGTASYSWPPTPTQARLRVQENVRRYTRNYAALSILVFACCLYATAICPLSFIPAFVSLLKQLLLLLSVAACVQVPDAYVAAGVAGQPRRVGGCAVLPEPVGARHTSARNWAGSSALCPDW
ncbi:hypothetical protein VPH35_089626 [Triticum aestivum]